MSCKKILVTGAGGFIGSHFAKYLLGKGYWIRGVARAQKRNYYMIMRNIYKNSLF